MKKLKELKFIDLIIHTLIGFILLLPIMYTLTPILVSMFSHSLNITMSDINTLWDTSMTHANTNFFQIFNDTQMLTLITNVLGSFNISNTYIANLLTYWILMGTLSLLFDIIMQTFIYLVKLLTPKDKKAE